MKKIILLLSLILFLCSCKNETNSQKTVNPIKQKTSKVKENIYRLSLFGEFKDDNSFSFWFVEDARNKFNSKQYLNKKVSGIEASQEVVFELDKNIILEKFRLRLARDSSNEEIKLDSIIISYNSKKIKIEPREYLKYLKVNKYVELDSAPTIRFKKIETNNKFVFDPFVISNEKLIDKLFNL